LWWILWTGLAHADADEVLARKEEPLRMRRYDRLSTTSPPRPYRRSRRGRFKVWTWPDGAIEHLEEWEGKNLIRLQTFNVSGTPNTTIMYREGQPHHALVHGPSAREVDLSDWTAWSFGGASFLLPGALGDETRLKMPTGWISWATGEESDVFADETREAFLDACACVVEDRSAFWVNGHVGVRYRLHFPHPEKPRTGETWAISDGLEGTLYIAAIVEKVTSDPGALSTARTVVSLMRLEPDL